MIFGWPHVSLAVLFSRCWVDPEVDNDGADGEEEWPPLTQGKPYDWRGEPHEVARLSALWKGELDHPYAVATVTGTAALALKLLGRAGTITDADAMAQRMWAGRAPLD